MMGIDWGIFVLALAGLIFGADMVVDQVEKLAYQFGLSSFLVGATIVAFGTSLPEMVASMFASYHDKADLAVANIIGSNIINITLVLGGTFLVGKGLSSRLDFWAKDAIWIFFPYLFFALTILDGEISKLESAVLVVLILPYLFFLIQSNKAFLQSPPSEPKAKANFHCFKFMVLFCTGLGFVFLGGHYSIESASNLARSFGVSEWMIGVFLVAFGTSLPELVVGLMAAQRGQEGIGMCMGNVIGSNIVNITLALGSAGLVGSLHFDIQNSLFDVFLGLVSTVVLICLVANRLYDKEAGIILLLLFVLFVNHAFASAFQGAK